MKALVTTLLFFICLQVSAPGAERLPGKKEFDFEEFKALVMKHCRFPEAVLAQAILETGWFESNLCKNHNNLFGMKANRRGYMNGSYNGHANYDHWIYSVLDYAKWQKDHYKGGDYLEFLKSIGYAEDPSYINKLRSIIKQFDWWAS